ncbi:MAG TPA: hypothetical protein VG371_03415 [Solirubrobacteraceae bacterium]|jgi:hypothetical protein|nr:hypothetical protein [Solirubrobacteraceae bacterium]
MMSPHLNAHLIETRQQEIAAQVARAQHRGELDAPAASRQQPWRRPILRRRPLALFTPLSVRRA